MLPYTHADQQLELWQGTPWAENAGQLMTATDVYLVAVMSRPAFCITRKRPPPVQVSDVKTTAASGGHLISNSHHGDGAEVDCQDVGTAAFVRQRNHHSPR